MFIHDHHSDARKRWLRQEQQGAIKQQPAQSDFEKSLAFRLTLLIALFVIGINAFSPAPSSDAATQSATHRPIV